MMFQCCTATTGGEDDTGLIDPYVFRGDDFIGLPAFQYTVLVDARRMGESITADDGFVGTPSAAGPYLWVWAFFS